MRKLFVLSVAVVFLSVFNPAAQAQPQPSMYTLDNIYYYLAEGAEASWGAHSLEPLSGVPGEDMTGFTKSLSDIYYYMVDTFGGCDAAPGQVMNTATFFSTDTANWGPKSGGISTVAITAANDSYPAGYHAGNVGGLDAIDTDLAVANIKAGVTIFGKAGDSNVVNTSAGDASAGDILSGKKAYVDGSQVTGSISSKGAQTYTPNTSNQTITAGQYLSGAQTISGDPDLTAAKIKDGVNIFGVTGTFPSDGNATDAQVLSGRYYYSNTSARHTGSISSKGAQTYTPTTSNQTIAAGQYLSGAQTISGDSDLVSANIRSGINIFNVSGNSNVVNTSSGTAVASDLAPGKIAWVDGQELVGPQLSWYETYGPCGTGDVVQIGSMYVASDMNGTGCAGNGKKNWASACSWGTGLDWLGESTGWRLPTQNELCSVWSSKLLITYQEAGYWSSTEQGATIAWGTDFNTGNCNYNNYKSGTEYVRAVRDIL